MWMGGLPNDPSTRMRFSRGLGLPFHGRSLVSANVHHLPAIHDNNLHVAGSGRKHFLFETYDVWKIS